MSKNIITTLSWIKKQNVKKTPLLINNDQKLEEMKIIENELKQKVNLKGNETIKEMTEKIENYVIDGQTGMDKLDQGDDFDNEEDDEFDEIPTFSSEFKKLANKQDTNNDNKFPDEIDDVSDDEKEDFTIHPTDNLIVCATAQDDISNLEVYIYDEAKQNLYVHHDILLSSYPLCLEWMSIDENVNGSKANFAVVGTFLPDIEVWNLDSLDALEPDMILGDPENQDKEKYYKKLKSKKINHDSLYHQDAVLSLSINPFNKKIIASGSVDSKIILWDLLKGQPLINYREHFDKVQTVKFNKCEESVLLSGSNDHSIKIFDIRNQKSSTQVKVNEYIESIDFSSTNKYRFLVSYESGLIEEYDIMKLSEPLFSFKAHKKAATSVSYSNQKNGLFASCSLDSHIKIWDGENLNSNKEPNLITEKFLKKTTGELFCVKFADDLDYTVAVGGSKGELMIWQLEQSKTFCDRYGLNWVGEFGKLDSKLNNLSNKKIMSNRIKFKSTTGATRRIKNKKI